jgi:hypothetical protein
VPDRAAVLLRFAPQLKYDSQEAFFADSAAEWTDNPGNVLRRAPKGGHQPEVIAAASPAPGQAQLCLDLLGNPAYADGAITEDSDHISNPHGKYRAQYVELRRRGGYANRMYARTQEDSHGSLWLQYWFFYFYNDYNLAGNFGLHEGDWEMVQLRMDGDEPDLAVYAQHRVAEKKLWRDVEKLPDNPDTPIVYVARGSHASYFEPGFHETEAWYDLADGKRRTPKLAVEILDEDGPAWTLWRGRWGDTKPSVSGLEQPSPDSPCMHAQWTDPRSLWESAREHRARKPRAAPEVAVSRKDGHLRLDYDFAAHAGAPEKLVVTVNSVDDSLPPRTFDFPVAEPAHGRIHTKIVLNPSQHYDIYVSTVDHAHIPSASQLTELDPVSDAGGKFFLLRWFALLVARLRGDRS